MTAETPQDRYTHGHHESVVQNHARRRAEVDAWFLLPRLSAGMSLLDVGCGPGTITVGLARAVAPGEVTGIDLSEEVLAQAREHAASESVDNLTFELGDVYQLDYEDGAFDVVYANQLLPASDRSAPGAARDAARPQARRPAHRSGH